MYRFEYMVSPQEYWRPKILFYFSSSIGSPLCIDSSSNKLSFDMDFGHYVRVMVYIDLAKDFSYKILVEQVGFSFYIEIEYERLLDYCSYYNCIRHNLDNYRRKMDYKDLDKHKVSMVDLGKGPIISNKNDKFGKEKYGIPDNPRHLNTNQIDLSKSKT